MEFASVFLVLLNSSYSVADFEQINFILQYAIPYKILSNTAMEKLWHCCVV
jgi:hypothetical protein